MKQLRHTVIRAGFDALYFTGAHHLLRPLLAGVGAIFMLHHVRPPRDDAFQPNHHLEITPEFLRATLAHVRELGADIVTLDEARRRLTERDFSRRFACFTCDDGYRDNRDHALPGMREFDAPFTVYVTSQARGGCGGWRSNASSPDRTASAASSTASRRSWTPARRPLNNTPSRGCTTGCAACPAMPTSIASSPRCARIMASTRM